MCNSADLENSLMRGEQLLDMHINFTHHLNDTMIKATVKDRLQIYIHGNPQQSMVRLLQLDCNLTPCSAALLAIKTFCSCLDLPIRQATHRLLNLRRVAPHAFTAILTSMVAECLDSGEQYHLQLQ